MTGAQNASLNVWLTDEDSGTTPASGSNYYRQAVASWNTPHVAAKVEKDSVSNFSPHIYFHYVKGKLSTIEMRRLRRRMAQLEKMVDEFQELGQEAMAEDALREYVALSRESAMWACDFRTFVLKKHLDKFKYKVKGGMKLTPIANFGRVIPKTQAKIIKKCMVKKLFDSYVVVHVDDKKSVKETEAERTARRKDPICFGQINEREDTFYFICDWEDEHCNLRLKTIVSALSLKKKDTTLAASMNKAKIKHEIINHQEGA